MHSGQDQFVKIAGYWPAVNAAGNPARRVRACHSHNPGAGPAAGHRPGAMGRRDVSIWAYFRVSFLPNCAGRRQTRQANPRGAKIPCPRGSYNEKYFFFWNQSVAAEIKDGARQLKFVYGSPDSDGGAVATLTKFCASLLYGVFSENPFRRNVPCPWLTPEV